MIPRFRDYMQIRSMDYELHAAVSKLYREGIDPFAMLRLVHEEGYPLEHAMILAEVGMAGSAPGQPPPNKDAAYKALQNILGPNTTAQQLLATLSQAAGVAGAGTAPSATSPPVAGAKPAAAGPAQPGAKPAVPGQPQTPPAGQPPVGGALVNNGQPAVAPQAGAMPGQPPAQPGTTPGQPQQQQQPPRR